MKKTIIWVIIVFIGLGVFSFLTGIIGDTTKVAKKEFGPEAALQKYEYFIDVSEMLDKKLKDVAIFEANLKSMKEDYNDIPRNEWDRIDKQQFNQWNMEIAGIKASYNTLAAEYNAKSQEFNWKVFKTENPKYKGVPETYIEN